MPVLTSGGDLSVMQVNAGDYYNHDHDQFHHTDVSVLVIRALSKSIMITTPRVPHLSMVIDQLKTSNITK